MKKVYHFMRTNAEFKIPMKKAIPLHENDSLHIPMEKEIPLHEDDL